VIENYIIVVRTEYRKIKPKTMWRADTPTPDDLLLDAAIFDFVVGAGSGSVSPITHAAGAACDDLDIPSIEDSSPHHHQHHHPSTSLVDDDACLSDATSSGVSDMGDSGRILISIDHGQH
jgi:hypothetical protein